MSTKLDFANDSRWISLVSEIHLFGSMFSHHGYSIQAPTGQALKWLMTEADYHQVAKSFCFLVAYVSSMMDAVWWRLISDYKDLHSLCTLSSVYPLYPRPVF